VRTARRDAVAKTLTISLPERSILVMEDFLICFYAR
jgi:hypothetical protein